MWNLRIHVPPVHKSLLTTSHTSINVLLLAKHYYYNKYNIINYTTTKQALLLFHI